MSLHIFANFVTPFGTAANNRAETDGNITTLQKIVWQGATHSTVSAEAIRFALRNEFAELTDCNRNWDEAIRSNTWRDPNFSGWARDGATYIDDDVLGFMRADAAKQEGESGSATVRRSPLEITRAISLTPWPGDVTFNAASPGATPSAQKQGSNPVPYGTEVHATRYQFGIAFTPERLRDPSRLDTTLRGLINLRKVAGNHGRFLFDFAPDSLVIRVTDDPAPRLLYCFTTSDGGRSISAASLLARIDAKDIEASELFVGGSLHDSPEGKELGKRGATVTAGVKEAAAKAIAAANSRLSESA